MLIPYLGDCDYAGGFQLANRLMILCLVAYFYFMFYSMCLFMSMCGDTHAMVRMWKTASFNPGGVARDGTRLVRLGSTHPYTLRHPSSLSLVFKGSVLACVQTQFRIITLQSTNYCIIPKLTFSSTDITPYKVSLF